MKRILALLGAVALTGCASVAGEKMQPVSVTTIFDSKEVAGLGCTLSNDAGSWFLTSPGSVTVHKSTGDLAIDCKKDAYVGSATAVSKSNGAVGQHPAGRRHRLHRRPQYRCWFRLSADNYCRPAPG
jgi:hypothetical protein